MSFPKTKPQNFSLDVKAKRLYSPRYHTQEKMAEFLGISLNEYKKIETGHMPKTRIFLPICRRLELDPMDYLNDALRNDRGHAAQPEDDPALVP